MDNIIFISLIEYLPWPLLVLTVFLFLRLELVALLRRLMGFRAGSVELQLSNQIHKQGMTKDQLEITSNLTNDELEIFLLVSFTDSLGFNYNTPLPPEVLKSRLLNLEKAGLLQILNPEDDGTNIRHNTTPLGRRFRVLLINSAGDLLRAV